jgi:DnaJ domain
MVLLVTIGLILMYLVWLGRGQPMLSRAEWRMGAGMTSIGALVAAGLLALRGQWEISAALVIFAVVLLLAARSRNWPILDLRALLAGRSFRDDDPQNSPGGRDVTLDEARAVLGVSETATKAEIRAAYTRLMRRAHPDHGGSTGLAAQLNAARDKLLKG